MVFNRYLWDLYLKAGGQDVVDKFDKFLDNNFDKEYPSFITGLMKDYCPDQSIINWVSRSVDEFLKDSATDLNKPEEDEIIEDNNSDLEDEIIGDSSKELPSVSILVEEFYDLTNNGYSPKMAFYHTTQGIPGQTTLCAFDDPENYIPYYFQGTFNVLERILSYLGIERPHVPAKARYEERLDYYEEISFKLNDFREEAELSPAELWALLYDYGPKVTGGMDFIIPEDMLGAPHNVFVFGDAPESDLTDPKYDHVISYQGNPDMQPGDLAVLYRWSSKSNKTAGSYYEAVWRAVAPGFFDPLSFHDRNVYYAHPIEIPRITIADLKADPLFSQTNLVRSKMTQMDGARMTNHEYLHLLEMAAGKGTIPEGIPTVPDYVEKQEVHIELEKDVEEQLIEPLLERLGWESQDYIRQMAVRIGRGVTKYPDYVLNFDTAGPSGEIVIEAKKTIPSLKQAEHDNGQARSYAKLIGARATALVSMEGVWIATQDDGFTKMKAYKWEELQDPDRFNELYEIIGKGKAKKRR